MRFFIAIAVLIMSLASPALVGSALAVQPDEVLKNPVLEKRARALSTELRCLVCQNQSIDDSDAGLAKDLRVLLRERLVAGDTDEEAKAYLVNRFGEFVLLKPVFAPHTMLLWFGPFILLGIGVIFLFRQKKKKPETKAETQLSELEQKQLEELMHGPKS